MQPGDLVELRAKSLELKRQQVKTEPYVSWKNRQFVFDETPLSDIFDMIESNYGLKVETNQAEIGELKLTYRIQGAELELLLTALSEVFDLRIERQNQRLIISKI
jgi:transmembrane sensor